MAFAKDLRASVLQAAMQGKLTEQLETDTPVSELLADIKAEKDRLISEKKIKKEKPLSTISDDDIPFDIPESWEWVRFGDIVYYNMGKTPPRAEPEWWKNDYPWVSIADMPENGHISKTKEMVSQKAIDEKFSKISPAGTMLMSFKLTVGRVSILDIDAVHNEAIISIYPHCDRNNIIQKYLFMLLPYVANAGNTKNAIKGKTLNNDSIRNLLIPLPPIEEQKRIVRRIEEIMKHIDELEAIEEELKKLKEVFPADMKAAVLQAAMQGKLTEQLETDSSVDDLLEDIKKEREKLVAEGKIKKSRTTQNDNFVELDNVLFDIPSSWKWVKLGDLFQHNTGKALNGMNQEGELYKYITTSNVYWDRFELDNLKEMKFKNSEIEKCQVVKGDLLVCEGGDIGRSAIWNKDFPIMCQNHIHRLRPYVSLNIKFYHLVLYLYKMAGLIGGKGIAIQGLSSNALHNIVVPLPPIEEQRRIVNKLETILPLIENI